MKTRHGLPLLAILLLVVVFSACRRGGRDEPVGILLVSNKIEIDEALRAHAAIFEAETGIRVAIRTFGGEVPYAPNLSAMFQAGVEPEIFIFEGRTGYDEARRSGRITDLSGEPWVRDTDLAYVSGTAIVGFPVAIEGWGLGYNRELLRRAGVDPATMVNIAGVRAAFEKIEAARDYLGIDAVVSMVAGPGMTWVTGLHAVNAYLTLGLPYYDADRYIDMLNSGLVDARRLTYFAEYMDLLFRHSVRDTLLTGGYYQQLDDFVLGRTVFIHQGNWTDPILARRGVDFGMGFVPHAFLPETTDGIFIGAPAFYMVNAKSPNVEQAKKFLRHMTATPEGHYYMVNRAGMVSAFGSVELRPPGQFSRAVIEWMESGRRFAWRQNEMPEDFGMDVLGPIFHRLAYGSIDVAEFVRLFAEAVAAKPSPGLFRHTETD